MAKNHGAKQQKKVAKQKAKRMEKRSSLMKRTSTDPTIRMAHADKWPVVQAMMGASFWKQGIGYLVLARQEAEGRLVFASYLIDVYCLGVKNTFWKAGTTADFRDLVEQMERMQVMVPIAPAALVKIIKGAVEYAQSFGFHPHADFRKSVLLLAGIDPSACAEEFTFGRDGKPYYIQGPHETFAQALAIQERVKEAGGEFIIRVDDPDLDDFDDEDDEDQDDENQQLPPPLPI